MAPLNWNFLKESSEKCCNIGWQVCTPNEVLVVTRKGHKPRLISSGRVFIWPWMQVERQSLNLTTILTETSIRSKCERYEMNVIMVSQVKANPDDLMSAVKDEQLGGSKSRLFRPSARTVLNSIVHKALTEMVQKITDGEDVFIRRVQEMANSELKAIGVKLISNTIKNIQINKTKMKKKSTETNTDPATESTDQNDSIPAAKQTESSTEGKDPLKMSIKQIDAASDQSKQQKCHKIRDLQEKKIQTDEQPRLSKYDWAAETKVQADLVAEERDKITEINPISFVIVQDEIVTKQHKEQKLKQVNEKVNTSELKEKSTKLTSNIFNDTEAKKLSNDRSAEKNVESCLDSQKQVGFIAAIEEQILPISVAIKHTDLVNNQIKERECQETNVPGLGPDNVGTKNNSPKTNLKQQLKIDEQLKETENSGDEKILDWSQVPWTFEISTEVCNKTGGIYTCIKSKAELTTNELGDHYVVIGPYYRNKSDREIKKENLQETSCLAEAVAEMRRRGFDVVTGRWKIPGSPLAVLFNVDEARQRVLDQYKWELKRDKGIDISNGDWESEQQAEASVVFGYLVAEFLTQFHIVVKYGKQGDDSSEPNNIVANFHEWLSGVGIIFLRHCWPRIDIATVFTTHATVLGRQISSGGWNLYQDLKGLDPERVARELNVYHKHRIEEAAAQMADVFTTVSEVTGAEANHFLHRKPDIFTPNGLNLPDPTIAIDRQKYRDKIDRFVQNHFYNYLGGEVFYFFSAGRNEYRNKGIDMLIQSLSNLNDCLTEACAYVQIIVFLIYPREPWMINGINEATRYRHKCVEHWKGVIRKLEERTGQKVYDFKNSCRMENAFLSDSDAVMLDQAILHVQKIGPAPITTHKIIDSHEDRILNELRRFELFNHHYDKVKIVYHPGFLDNASNFFKFTYNDLVQGSDLGIFPSYYEPWGYTPAECAVVGTPSVTTNLAGFERFMEQNTTDLNLETHGLYIINRAHQSYDESVDELSNCLLRFTQQSQIVRQNQRELAKNLSSLFDWKTLANNYSVARRMALEKQFKRRQNV